jgi:translation initiation factor 1
MADGKTPFHNPFAGLRDLTGVPSAPQPARAEPVEPTPLPRGVKPIARAVVRIERSGRGGKEVTLVEHLGLGEADRQRWVKELKAALGCGGSVEGDALALQGDQRDRLPALLQKRGVRKVTVA